MPHSLSDQQLYILSLSRKLHQSGHPRNIHSLLMPTARLDYTGRGYAVVATDYARLGNHYTDHKYCTYPAHANDVYYSCGALTGWFNGVEAGRTSQGAQVIQGLGHQRQVCWNSLYISRS
ncbi:Vacuolar amino acid transporter 1 [Fusarium oxysporum f. sp. albedinis]|nr:Vacuolar amino acid transporter 1 [Fusarium oxysporum f. sp. albedinis]